MSKILMLKGLPASGKTTYAKTLVYAKKYKRINKDDLRAMLDDSEWSKSNEIFILHIRDMIIIEALEDNQNVVVDDTNFAPKHEQTLRDIAKEFKASFEVKFFDTPVEECIARDLKRHNSVGSKVIMQMYNQYIQPTSAMYIPPKNAPMAIICDIDGTLAHHTNRSPYDWSRVEEDTLDVAIAEITWGMEDMGYDIILVSGRDEVCRKQTERWLNKNKVYCDALFMRPEGDNRKDVIIKQEIYDREIRDKYNIVFVLDDRNQVVEFWRSLGLKCLQVAEGDF